MDKGLTLKNNTPQHFYFCDTPMRMAIDGLYVDSPDSEYVLPVFRRKAEAMAFAKKHHVGIMHVSAQGVVTRVRAA
jgi:hypothetical protein